MKTATKKRNQCKLSLSPQALLISLFFFITGWMNGQAPGWTWAKSVGGAGALNVSSNAVSTINGGAVYTLGSFAGEIDIDPGPDTILVNSGAGYDLYIIKQDEAGEYIWGRTIGGTNNIDGNIITVNAVHGESVYVAGKFSGTIDFDPGPNEFTITSSGMEDIFILKLDADGNFLWAKRMGGSGLDQAFSLAIDQQDGYVYTTGYFETTVDFDPGPNSYFLQAVGSWDIFISKLDENGSFLWAKGIGSNDTDFASSIAVDPASGDIYTTGKFWDTADFDPGPGTYSMTSFASIFILKLNDAGTFQWAKQIEQTYTHFPRSIVVDPNGIGSVYLAGEFNGSTDFDPGPNVHMLTSAGIDDIFILKLDTTGAFAWVKQIGGEAFDFCASMVLSDNGDIYLTGGFEETCDFDPGSNMFILTSEGSGDIFVSRLNRQGELGWAISMGNAGWDVGVSIAIDTSSTFSPFITGYFSGTVDFDPGPGTFNLEEGDVFNLKLDTAATFYWANELEADLGGRASGKKIAMEPESGTSVTVGEFQGKVDFDPGSGSQLQIAEGIQDIFITSFDSSGQWLWTKTISSIDGVIISKALRIDPFDQSIYLLGQFTGNIDFDPGSGIQNVSASYSEYSPSTFLLKLSASGQFLWVRTILSNDTNGSNCWSHDLAVDACGHLYITGNFSNGPVDFDPGPGQFLMHAGEYAGYLLKLDTLGYFVWVRRIGSESSENICYSSPLSIAMLPDDESMYVTGSFAGTCEFDESGSEYTTEPEWDNDIFIAKLDSSGLTHWVKTIGNAYTHDYAMSICTDRNVEKNLYLFGTFEGPVDFDPDTGSAMLYNNLYQQVYLLKLDSTGSFVWVKGFEGPGVENAIDMTVDTLGHTIYLTGNFEMNMDADPGPDIESLVSHGGKDLFFIATDESGDLKYAEGIGTSENEEIAGLSRNSGARVLLTGTFDYPNMSLGSILVENAGPPTSEDAFFGMYEGCTGVVINTLDDGFGSLRNVIACSSSGDTIVFDLSLPNQITLSSGEILIQKNITISGPGVDQLSISGNNASRIFNLDVGYSFGLNELTLKQAAFPSLGGAMLVKGHAILENVRLEQNHESSLPKAMSLVYPGELEIFGNVEIKY